MKSVFQTLGCRRISFRCLRFTLHRHFAVIPVVVTRDRRLGSLRRLPEWL